MSKVVFGLGLLVGSMVGCAVQTGDDPLAKESSALRNVGAGDDSTGGGAAGDDTVLEQKKKKKKLGVGDKCHVSGTREVAFGTIGDNGWCCGVGQNSDGEIVKDVCVNCNNPPEGAKCAEGNTRVVGVDIDVDSLPVLESTTDVDPTVLTEAAGN